MSKIIALGLIGYGLFELFFRNFLRSYRNKDTMPWQPMTWRLRLKRFKTSLPAYGAVLLGMFLLVASLNK